MNLFKKNIKKPYTTYNVTTTKEFLQSDNYKKFCDAAYEAYDKENNKFFKKLSNDELVVLLTSCYLHEDYHRTLAYDDEVFDALCRRKNFEKLMDLSNVLIFNNLHTEAIEWAFAQHFPEDTGLHTEQEKREMLIQKTKILK